ncbi:MAG: HigA family addiction module antitoxin [Mariprofundaceae bacterium]|nr:HigA family addiction module antitoxin [Mariprofundaceae bacterium]
MSVRMEDLAGMDFSDVASGERLVPVAPGDVLLHEFMEPMGLSANALAKALKVPTNRVTGIINGTRNITADTALRLQAAFGVSATAWLGLQSRYNLEQAEAELADKIAAEVHRLAA